MGHAAVAADAAPPPDAASAERRYERRAAPRRPAERRAAGRPDRRGRWRRARRAGAGRQEARRDTGKATQPDRVFLPHAKDAIPIRPNSAEMFVLQHLRDEAHRFAITFHRNSAKRLTLRSALSTIPGIGAGPAAAAAAPLRQPEASPRGAVEELVAVPGMTRKAAEAVFAHWAKQPLSAAADRRPRDLRGAGDRRRLHQHRRSRRRDDAEATELADATDREGAGARPDAIESRLRRHRALTPRARSRPADDRKSKTRKFDGLWVPGSLM